MWYHPAASLLDKRDVFGAWLICLVIATVFFGYPVVTTALDSWVRDRHSTVADRLLLADQSQATAYPTSIMPGRQQQCPRGRI